MKGWKKYQEDSAEYFKSIELSASTDKTVQGVRTKHDVDVLVTSHYVGFDITWVVECKCWRKAVNKLHVLALREIVSDIGADRGILLSESGFQSGALEAANLTNIQVTSLDNLRNNTSESIYAMRLRDLYDRVYRCKDRYWNISKKDRIQYELRPDSGEYGYSGAGVVDMCFDLLGRAFRGVYPFKSEDVQAFIKFGKDKEFKNHKEIIDIIETELDILEMKLNSYEASIPKA